jgi:hypothetical protein
MGNNLDELASYFEPKAQQLISNCALVGIPVRVINTGRTADEQTIKIQQGVSWTKFSKHEPQPPEMKSEAIDVCPLAVLEENKANWDPKNPLWQKIGNIGKNLGLVWGGDWRHIGETAPGKGDGTGDPGHFEWKSVPGVLEA